MTTRAGHEPRVMIALGRRYRHQTQTQLAEALTEKTGEPWTRDMVTALEGGRKRFDVDTLMAIAEIHQLPHSFYLEPPRDQKGAELSAHNPRSVVSFPGGAVRPTDNRPPARRVA